MSIDKEAQKRSQRVPLHDFLGSMVSYLIVLTVPVGIGLCLWALELGVLVRTFSEALKWSYDLFGF